MTDEPEPLAEAYEKGRQAGFVAGRIQGRSEALAAIRNMPPAEPPDQSDDFNSTAIVVGVLVVATLLIGAMVVTSPPP